MATETICNTFHCDALEAGTKCSRGTIGCIVKHELVPAPPTRTEEPGQLTELEKALLYAAKTIGNSRMAGRKAANRLSFLEEQRETQLALLRDAQEALTHMKSCGACAEDSWSTCEGGRQADVVLARLSKLFPSDATPERP